MEVLTSIYQKIREIVSSAQESIYLASAWLRSAALEELFSSIPKGVKDFKVVLRASELKDLEITDERVFELVRERGGKIYLHPRLHAKFILVDGKFAVVGSANFTHSGLSDYERGNVEAAVFYSQSDDAEEVEKLRDYFEKIIGDGEAVYLDERLIGFSMNPVKSRSFEFVLLEEAGEQEYVELRSGERRLIGRIKEIYAYDMDFFANPFTAGESAVFAPLELFKTLFARGKSSHWKKAAVFAHLNSNGAKLKIALVEALGELKEERLETPLKPFSVASPVFRIGEEELGKLLKRNFSGRPMEKAVKVGKLLGSEADVFIDASEVLSKHLLVLGTTGSGKSYFTKLFLKRLLEAEPEVKVFVLDPHGEYSAVLKKFGVKDEDIWELTIPDVLLPVYPEEVEELVKQLGYASIVSGNTREARENKALIAKHIKPSLRLTGLREKSLREVLGEFSSNNAEVEGLLSSAPQSFDSQPELLEELSRAINCGARVVIFNFKKVGEPSVRVNVAGLVMKELFEMAKEDGRKRFLILEEAHSFAPEKGFGDTSAGRDNLALIMARKIASEGRKFNLGLGVITQRPAQVSKFVLSQTNTQVMFRTINSSDLSAVSSFVEYAGEEVLSLLPSLQTGMGIVCGMGVPFTLLVRVC